MHAEAERRGTARYGSGTVRARRGRYPSCRLKSKFADGSPVNIPHVPLMWFTLIRDFSIAILG